MTDDAQREARRPHAVLDAPSRVLKARKIVELVGPAHFARARRILEIGCGSGVIAATLAELGGPGLEVFAVDVADNRLVRDGYTFAEVRGTALPFDAKTFDIVITNHVIEHVGDAGDQLHHLEEIRRVLVDDGIGYLAVPNTWRLVEPHYRLPFLSWLPQAVADRYVRATGRGTYYDCVPLSHGEACALFGRAEFEAHDLTIDAIRETLRLEHPAHVLTRIVERIPDSVLRLAMPVIPTIMFRLRKRAP